MIHFGGHTRYAVLVFLLLPVPALVIQRGEIRPEVKFGDLKFRIGFTNLFGASTVSL